LKYERSTNFVFPQVRLALQLETLIEGARRDVADLSPSIKERLVDLYIRSLALQRTVRAHIDEIEDIGTPGIGDNASTVFWSELYQDVGSAGVEFTGLGSSAPEVGIQPDPDWRRFYLTSLSATIAGGTSEIQRNIIAERGLGLPR
jgi:alkylation response protein AidB-like acyl-CoA dehydrogenase